MLFFLFQLFFIGTRRFYLTGDMTNHYSFKVRCNDQSVVIFSLMHLCRIKTNLLFLVFPCGKV